MNTETFEQVKERARKVLEMAQKVHPAGTVLFVGHGYLNKTIIKIITGEETDHPQDNAAVNIFDIENKTHLINCMKHLK